MKTKSKSIGVLTEALVSCLATATYLRASHWNVEGDGFFPLHEFYGEQYGVLDENADDLAERILALGSYAVPHLGKVAEVIKAGPEGDGNPLVVTKMLEGNRDVLRVALDAVTGEGDLVTQNMLLTFIEAREKALWKLKAHCVDEE